MQHPDEGTIHAWIDGELSQEEATALEAHLAECRECSEKAAEARGLVAASSRIVSALDIIPGGVIPAAPARRRPWYASTQLRAAAAITIVAGASMLVMRDRNEATMDSVLSVTAPAPVSAPPSAPATVGSDLSTKANEPPVAQSTNQASAAEKKPSRDKAISGQLGKSEKATVGRVAEAPPPPSAPVPMAASSSAADEASAAKIVNAPRDSAQRRFNAAPMLSDVVVTGVATAVEGLKEVSADSSAGRRRTTYEVQPGVNVTLTDVPVEASAERRDLQRKEAAKSAGAAAASSAPTTSMRAALKPAPVTSISWVDKRGHTMTLSGPLSREQLERVRQLLPEEKR